MGGLFAKPVAPKLPQAPTIDYSAAKFDASYVQQLQQQAAQAVAATGKQLTAATGALSWTSYKIAGSVVGTIALIVGGILLYDLMAQRFGWPTVILSREPAVSSAPSGTQNLVITSAVYGAGTNVADVSAAINSKIVNGMSSPSFLVNYSDLGLSKDPVEGATNTLTVTWYFGNGPYTTTVIASGSMFPALPILSSGGSGPMRAPPPPLSHSFFASITGGGSSSGDLLGSSHDASTSLSVPGTSAPLSDQGDGAYGMQWWMFVKDWNYGFGKKKSIVKRPDATNSSVLNPHISLHPTDNTLQVSVSLFPSSEGAAGKDVPAPAGHSGSTDDVFVCEVPNIPLQAWFSVSVSVFGRNMDIYIDGKLVKSCFLPGVPKPAVGDIQMTPDGGFSGQMCGFNHYPRMLTPSDALNFWSAGSSCQSASPGSTPASKATGYAVKFGVYNSLGKQVQEYSF